MTLPIFPSLPGQGWPLTRAPAFQSFIGAMPSGREVRLAANSYPVQDYTLSLELLRSGAGFAEFETLAGFYLGLQGGYGDFLYDDPADNRVFGQALGAGDGATLSFAVVRSFGGATAPVGQVNGLSAVYLNNAAQPPAAYRLVLPATLVFQAAPAAGVEIGADFSFYHRCRFVDDKPGFAEVASQLHQLKSLRFRTQVTVDKA